LPWPSTSPGHIVAVTRCTPADARRRLPGRQTAASRKLSTQCPKTRPSSSRKATWAPLAAAIPSLSGRDRVPPVDFRTRVRNFNHSGWSSRMRRASVGSPLWTASKSSNLPSDYPARHSGTSRSASGRKTSVLITIEIRRSPVTSSARATQSRASLGPASDINS
jgi:hypothetical protein